MAQEDYKKDLVLAPNEFAFLKDGTSGQVIVCVGPHKSSPGSSDLPVYFDGKKFLPTTLDNAIQIFHVIPENWYAQLKNPSPDAATQHPKPGASQTPPKVDVGKKINIKGPASFALWPGQMVRVVKGHQLHSNEYLRVRVYDEESARANWGSGVVRKREGDNEVDVELPTLPDLSTGREMIIKGTDVSFYIPPTGIEVVPETKDQYVRNAVTLERLEYCILLDENGNKRYIEGPDVVFPNPTETFVEVSGRRKFKAIELNDISGIYVKVIAPYTENGVAYKVGEELFITGKDQTIYYPREEHAIIKYGDSIMHYAVCIPEGEGRYVLDRTTGVISLKRGPRMFLCDPRNEVIVRRILTQKETELWFPGNIEAKAYNEMLSALNKAGGATTEDFVSEDTYARMRSVDPLGRSKKTKGGVTAAYSGSVMSASGTTAADMPHFSSPQLSNMAYSYSGEAISPASAASQFVGDDFERKTKFSPPRSISLEDTKYEGAVRIEVWTGYAVMVKNKTGKRQVIVGPDTYLLEYDETLEAFELSTGNPKSADKVKRASYLRVSDNQVSDTILNCETRDMCPVQIGVTYWVNFDKEDIGKWFNVENYPKALTDHCRSLLKNNVRQYDVGEFYKNAYAIIRDVIIGKAEEGATRPGRKFNTNGMHIFDVQITDVSLMNPGIGNMLTTAQHDAIKDAIELTRRQTQLNVTREIEDIKRKVQEELTNTYLAELSMSIEKKQKDLAVRMTEIESEFTERSQSLDNQLAEKKAMFSIVEADLSRKAKEEATKLEILKASTDLELTTRRQELAMAKERLEAEASALAEKMKAITPDMISGLNSFVDKDLMVRTSEAMAPLAILGGESIVDILNRFMKGTTLENILGSRSN
jgi:major vault protein